MAVIFNESDTISGRITIRGLLNYILRIYHKKKLRETLPVDEETATIIQKASYYVVEKCREACKQYGINYPEIRN